MTHLWWPGVGKFFLPPVATGGPPKASGGLPRVVSTGICNKKRYIRCNAQLSGIKQLITNLIFSLVL